MTVIVQQPKDSNGNPQPMVYDSDTGKIIVDSNGFIVSGSQKLVNVPSKANYVSTPKTQTSGIQEAWNYVRSFATSDSAFLPKIQLTAGNFIIHAPIYLKYTSPPPNVQNVSPYYNSSAVTSPSLIGSTGENGQYNYVPLATAITCADDFPKGEYAIALILPDTAWYSGATNPQWVGGVFENFTLDNNNLGAGICLFQFGNGEVKNIAVRSPTTPSPSLTQGISTGQQSDQTGAFVYTTTEDSGEFTDFSHIQIRGSSYEDGFVLYENAGTTSFNNLWCAGGATRYGFNVTSTGIFPMLFENCESDPTGGWTGSVPSGYPQSAAWVLNAGNIIIENNGTFVGAPPDGPYIYHTANQLTLIGGYFRGYPNASSATNYIIETTANSIIAIGSGFEYNSEYYGVFRTTNADNIADMPQEFIGCRYSDDNTGTPVYKPFNINWGFSPPWQSTIKVEPFFDSRGRYLGGFSPTLSANPPVSGTVYQNQNPYPIEIELPVYATTSGTAGYVTIAKGSTDSPTSIGNQYVSGDTSDTSEQIIRLRVPTGWYYEFTASGVTFGTASVFAE